MSKDNELEQGVMDVPFEVSCKTACLSIKPAPILVAAWNVGGGDSDLAGEGGAAAAGS